MWMLAADKSDKICSILIWFNLTQFCSETHWNFVNVSYFCFQSGIFTPEIGSKSGKLLSFPN